MKVIERKDWNDWRLSVWCRRCESKLEVEPPDIKAQYFSDDGPNRPGGYNYYCHCAVCSDQLYLNASDVPLYLQDQAQKAAPRRPE
jgi:hypothetical protein